MTKRVFISYSHDSDDHKNWVRSIAALLIKHGVEVILDQWDLRIGEEIPRFVEESILNSDRVLLFCTENYVAKANKRVGGVGLEALVINSTLMEDLGSTKFIAIVKQNGEQVKLPELLKNRLYINLSHDETFDSEMERLVREIHGVGNLGKPPLGPNPFDQNDSDENNTKLDLARAYIELGDKVSGANILLEIMNDGNLIQQKEARQLLSRVKVG